MQPSLTAAKTYNLFSFSGLDLGSAAARISEKQIRYFAWSDLLSG